MFLLQIAIKDTISQSQLLVKSDAHSNNFWLYLAFVELFIIILLFIYINILKRTQVFTKFEKEIFDAKRDISELEKLL